MPLLRTTFLLCFLAFLSGCGGTSPPPGRLGGLPFPGLFTLYSPADPAKLGHHRSDKGPISLPPYETDRGMVYTCQAGFVDLAHLRNTIDWTHYYADHVRDALEEKKKAIELQGPNYSRIRFAFRYPDDWGTMSKEQRRLMIDELSVRIGQRTAYAVMAWHELITWYGFKWTMLFDEQPSSFTWDDVTSHVIGMRIGGKAWRVVNIEKKAQTDFNGAVTEVLAAELTALHAVTAEQTDAAVKAVEGRWWKDGKPLRRQLDIGLTTGRVTPWVVAGLPFCSSGPPRDFGLPDLNQVEGRDFRDFCTVEIDPRIGQANEIRSKLEGKPRYINVERDLPVLVEDVRKAMRAQFGNDVDKP